MAPERTHLSGGGAPRRPHHVVLVEDHPVLRRRFAGELIEAGLTVVAVDSLRAGHEAVAARTPDVAVVDSLLPDGRGLDFCRVLRTAQPHVVLLLHTGLISWVETQEALEVGVAAVVPKAIRGGDLVAAVLLHAPPVAGLDGHV